MTTLLSFVGAFVLWGLFYRLVVSKKAMTPIDLNEGNFKPVAAGFLLVFATLLTSKFVTDTFSALADWVWAVCLTISIGLLIRWARNTIV